MEKAIVLPANWRTLSLLPSKLVTVLDKWQRIADKEIECYKFGWPAKLVHTDFTCDGQRYSVTPETFGVEGDLMECLQQGPYITDKYGSTLTDDLKEAGFSNVISLGFLD